MSTKELGRLQNFIDILHKIDATVVPLPGLDSDPKYECLGRQLVDSRRRIEYIYAIRDGSHDKRRSDPGSTLFDPLKAAVLQLRSGNLDEAYWLVFLAVHFGKHAADGWLLTREVYGKLGGPGRWDWAAIRASPQAFGAWLKANQQALSKGRFSNHRKYESLRADSEKGTANVFASYVNWVMPPRSHAEMVKDVHLKVGQNPSEVFDYLYRSMDDVLRFGRLGRFDFLTMLGKLGIAPIEPGSAYLWHNATGPKKGARLLLGGSRTAAITPKELDQKFSQIDEVLGVGMQALEDSLCNWQKNPTKYELFRG